MLPPSPGPISDGPKAPEAGRRRAEELGVTSVPTVRLGDDYRILLRGSDLAELVAELGGSLG